MSMDSQESPTNIGQFQIRILLVDDDSTTLSVVSSMLQIWSYEVETAKNPLDALATLRMQKGSFDLVLTDLHMPFMNGFELKKQIDREFKLPVIMMSADEQENVILQSLRNGIVLHLKKPVKPDDLRDVWQFAIKATKGKSVVRYEGASEVRSFGDTRATRTLNIGGQRQISHGQPSSGGGPITKNPRNQYKRASDDIDNGKRAKKICKRKDPNEQPEPRRKKKMKVVWTNSLHNRFLLSMRHLGYDRIVPKRVLEFMNVPGLTRENVASHLQKYRLFLRKVAENGVVDAARVLADKFMRSSFAAGYPIQLIIQHAQQMYPELYRKARQRLNQSETASVPEPPPPTPFLLPSVNNNNNEASSSRVTLPPVGLSTLLMDNPPSTANIAMQPRVSRVRPNDQPRTGDSFLPKNYSFNNKASGMYTLAIGDNVTANERVRRRPTTENSLPSPSRVVHSRQPAMTQFNVSRGPHGQGGLATGLSEVSGGFADRNEGYTNPTSVFRQKIVNYREEHPVRPASPTVLPPQQTQYLTGPVTNANMNFGGNGFIQNFPNQTDELRVEDYACDFSDVTFEDDEPFPMITQANDIANNAAPSIEQPFGQVQQQGNEHLLLQNPSDNGFPTNDDYFPCFDQNPLQPQGNGQVVGGNALASDNSFNSLVNQMNLQPQGNEQVIQNFGGNALPSNNSFNSLVNQMNLQPQGIKQTFYIPEINALPIPSDDNNMALLNQNIPLQLHGNDQLQVLENPSNDNIIVPSTDVQAPHIDQTPSQQPITITEDGDPFEHIDLDNLETEANNWEKLMENLLNDPDQAPEIVE